MLGTCVVLLPVPLLRDAGGIDGDGSIEFEVVLRDGGGTMRFSLSQQRRPSKEETEATVRKMAGARVLIIGGLPSLFSPARLAKKLREETVAGDSVKDLVTA